MTYKLTVTTLALTAITSTVAATHAKPDTEHPHIVLILCDDMGFSDLSCYGGEIHTPNIDYLAEQGIRFSQFKNTGRSCPSRAALLTGHYQHEAGMGWMTAVDEHRPGYRGQISDHLPTLAEVLRDQGYATYMSGKWHVTLDAAFETPNGSYPVQRGFDKYYGCLHGGGSYYKPDPVYHNLQRITEFPDDYYYTTAITDSAVSFIKQHPTQTPMFMYIAHYAPHLPLDPRKIGRIFHCRFIDSHSQEKTRHRLYMDLIKLNLNLYIFHFYTPRSTAAMARTGDPSEFSYLIGRQQNQQDIPVMLFRLVRFSMTTTLSFSKSLL